MHKNAEKKHKENGTTGNLEPKGWTIPLKVRQSVDMIYNLSIVGHTVLASAC